MWLQAKLMESQILGTMQINNPDTDLIRQQIISILKEINKHWQSCQITFIFPPTINRGYKTQPSFQDILGTELSIFLPFNPQLDQLLYSFIYKMNRTKDANKIVLTIQKGELEEAVINVMYDPLIVENFQANLPKSKRNKTIPWWANPDETKGLT